MRRCTVISSSGTPARPRSKSRYLPRRRTWRIRWPASSVQNVSAAGVPIVGSQKTCTSPSAASRTVARNWRAVNSTSGNSGIAQPPSLSLFTPVNRAAGTRGCSSIYRIMLLKRIFYHAYSNCSTLVGRSHVPGVITCFQVFYQSRGRELAQAPGHHNVTSSARRIANGGKENIGRESRREQCNVDSGQRDHHKRREADHLIVIAWKDLIFCAAIEGERQFRAIVGFATPKSKRRTMHQFMQRQDDEIAYYIDE